MARFSDISKKEQLQDSECHSVLVGCQDWRAICKNVVTVIFFTSFMETLV